MEKVVLTTGGTGGHIFPALAVAEELRKRHPGIQLLFIGSLYGPEKSLAAKYDIPFEGLYVRGFLGRGFRAFPAAMRMLKALIKARSILANFRSDAVAGFGGYASFAPMAAARSLGIPTLLHEQNAISGTGNRFLSRFANRICVSFADTAGLPPRQILVGNPIRKGITTASVKRQFDPLQPRLLVLGGSQGAHALNVLMEKLLPELKKRNVLVTHQTGQADLEKLRQAYAKNGYPESSAQAFIDDMAKTYQWADLAICRAGASTVFELCAAGLPAMLVPFPAAIHDHQSLNARALSRQGGAFLVQERELDPDKVLKMLDSFINKPEKLAIMAKNAFSLARPDAAALLADNIEALCGEKNL